MSVTIRNTQNNNALLERIAQLESALSSKADSSIVSQLETQKASKNEVNGYTRAQGFVETTLPFSNNVVWDCDLNQVTKMVCTSNFNLLNPTNVRAGYTYEFLFIQDSTGNRIITFDTAYKFSNDIIPILSNNPNSRDRLTAIGNSNGTLDCVLNKNF